MIRILFLSVLCLHGLIHLMGFFKAFGLAELSQLTGNISRSTGIVWLFAFLLFLLSGLLFGLKLDWWWMVGAVALLTSQVLIVGVWSDAKYGTIVNVIVLIGIIIGFGSWGFERQVAAEVNQVIAGPREKEIGLVSEEEINSLPRPVRNWLVNTGIQGRERVRNVYLEQTGEIRLNPDQKWANVKAKQYINAEEPAFLWRVDMNLFSILPVKGRDKFQDGHGAMTIKLASLIPIVNVSSNPRIDEGALQRYLAELVWYPSTALSSYVTWEGLDDSTAKATMNYKGITGSVNFHFTSEGEVRKITAKRYKGTDEAAQRRDWIIDVQESGSREGINMPTKMEVSWGLEEERFTWYRIDLTEMKYDQNAVK